MFDFEDEIREFWIGSLKNDFSDFDFDQFIDEFKNRLEYQLAQHGYMGVDRYMESNEYEHLADDIPYWATISNPWISVDKEQVLTAIMELHIEVYKRDLPSTYDELMELWEKLQFLSLDEDDPEQLKQLISIVDECIHAEHVTGMIIEELDGTDLNDFRAEVEQEWKEELQEEWESRHISIREIRNNPKYI